MTKIYEEDIWITNQTKYCYSSTFETERVKRIVNYPSLEAQYAKFSTKCRTFHSPKYA